MRPQRFIALCMLAVAAVAHATTSSSQVFLWGVIAAGALGATGLVNVPVPRQRRLIFMLLLGTAFALRWRYLPFDDQSSDAYLFFRVTYALGQYLLALMVLLFYLHPRVLPVEMPVFGAMAMLCAGNIHISATHRVSFYGILAFLFTILAAAYLSQCHDHSGRRVGLPERGRRGWIALALLLGTIVGIGGSRTLANNRDWLTRRLHEIHVAARPAGDATGAFGDELELGSRSERPWGRHADRIVLRVQSQGPPGYLRGQVYDQYVDRPRPGLRQGPSQPRWTNRNRWRDVHPANPAPDRVPLPRGEENVFLLREMSEGNLRTLRVWATQGTETSLLAPLEAAAVTAAAQTVVMDENQVVVPAEMRGGVDHLVHVPEAMPREVLHSDMAGHYLDLPTYVRFGPIASIAQEVLAEATTAAEKIAAVEAWFTTNYEYQLGIDIPEGQDPLEYFLLERPAAHCEYFAAGAAVLLRLGGVPTRYVAGFVPSEYSHVGGYWIARNRDAHAWVEAYDPQRGWVTVEATPSGGTPQGNVQAAGWLGQLWDAVVFELHQLRVRIWRDGWRGLLGWALEGLWWLGRLLVTTVPGLLMLSVAILLLIRRVVRRRKRRQGGRDVSATVHQMQMLLATMDRRTRRLGWVRQPGETLHAFSRRLTDGNGQPDEPITAAADWYVRYAVLRYAQRPVDGQLDALRQSLPFLPRRYRKGPKHQVQGQE